MVTNDLEDKILGCIAGAHVGSAMGDPVEIWLVEEIEEEYGWIDHLPGDNDRTAGTTEDGIERLKLQTLSIIENNGPITSQELARTWLKYTKEESFGNLAGKQDQIHHRLIEAGIPPEDSGYHDAYPGRVGPHRCSHANGIVNACKPELAAQAAIDVARIYQPPKGRGIAWEENDWVTDFDSRKDPFDFWGGKINPTFTIGLDWSGAICAGIAEAMKPSSTIDSVIEEATAYVVSPVAKIIREGVKIGEESDSYEELRDTFYEIYTGHSRNLNMMMGHANEVVPKAFGLFVFFEDDVRKTMEGAVNFGRDTDCTAAISAGLAGAYNGSETIPDEWIEQVNHAATVNPYTVTDMPLQEQANGLYEATVAHHKQLQEGADAIDSMS